MVAVKLDAQNAATLLPVRSCSLLEDASVLPVVVAVAVVVELMFGVVVFPFFMAVFVATTVDDLFCAGAGGVELLWLASYCLYVVLLL